MTAKYYDIEQQEIITLEELQNEYAEADKEEYPTFGIFVNACCTSQGGTLEPLPYEALYPEYRKKYNIPECVII